MPLAHLEGGSTAWTEYTYALTTAGHATRLEFVDASTSDALGTFVDDVSIVALTFSGEETAWGDGEDFPGADWATYFRYTVCDP